MGFLIKLSTEVQEKGLLTQSLSSSCNLLSEVLSVVVFASVFYHKKDPQRLRVSVLLEEF
jgi:hypothetical protein